MAKDTLQEISDALNPTLSELQGLQKTSKELQQRKIMNLIAHWMTQAPQFGHLKSPAGIW